MEYDDYVYFVCINKLAAMLVLFFKKSNKILIKKITVSIEMFTNNLIAVEHVTLSYAGKFLYSFKLQHKINEK